MRPLQRLVLTLVLVVLSPAIGAATSSQTLYWDYVDGGIHAVGYRIYRQPWCTGAYVLRTPVLLTVQTYTDVTVGAGIQYCWRATAVDAGGTESVVSNTVNVTVAGARQRRGPHRRSFASWRYP
jgi:fibronectin type 3 domain-containing protein